MSILSVGQPYHPNRNRWPEAAQYNFRSGRHELVLFWPSPSPQEVEGVRVGRADFGLFFEPPVILLLYRFAGACDWSDAPYSIHLVPQEERLAPEAVSPEARALLSVVLVDADTGLVRALRAITMSPGFTRLLHAAIAQQLAYHWDATAYDQALASIYRRFPESRSLVRACKMVERGGL
ncbi:MAG: hypothetical protein KatS3mg082_1780 [Nitrospiraceae bacterium]|nr:MAG: hypothetical protein KatS3mg082_1780 [Nitrospiraceae bacterium]